MAERKRNKEIHFYVTEEERKLIRRKMIESKTKNMGAYLRKMAIDGYIVNTDTTPLKKDCKEGEYYWRSVSGRNARIERDGERIMAYLKIFPIKVTDKKALNYITNPDKTDEKLLVSSFGCSPETADLEFSMTREMAKKNGMDKGDNLAFHLIQSFKPGEVDAETAHRLGQQFADEVLKGKYEYVISTHVDKNHS